MHDLWFEFVSYFDSLKITEMTGACVRRLPRVRALLPPTVGWCYVLLAGSHAKAAFKALRWLCEGVRALGRMLLACIFVCSQDSRIVATKPISWVFFEAIRLRRMVLYRQNFITIVWKAEHHSNTMLSEARVSIRTVWWNIFSLIVTFEGERKADADGKVSCPAGRSSESIFDIKFDNFLHFYPSIITIVSSAEWSRWSLLTLRGHCNRNIWLWRGRRWSEERDPGLVHNYYYDGMGPGWCN